MTAHYKEPILLIEFDEKKSFNLEVRPGKRLCGRQVGRRS